MIGQSRLTLREPAVYVCRDIERALGLPPTAENYYIVTNSGVFAKSAAEGRGNVILIKEKKLLDTRELLARPETAAREKTLNNPRTLVFKNTVQIEKLCREKGWELLNPPAGLARRVEEKISQLAWLGTLTKHLPPHRVELCENLPWTGKKYIVQFNHAHTGLGTMLIASKQSLAALKKKFPKRSVRVADFIAGPAFTNNNVVWGKRVLVGSINYQITGLAPFTAHPFTTVGNDWALPRRILNNKQIKQFKQIAAAVGKKLMKDGWRGLFGIDAILDEKTDRLYLIEINARQPASAVFESELQRKSGGKGLTTFEAHLAALLKMPYRRQKLIPVGDGAQIIKRMPKAECRMPNQTLIINKLKKLGLNIIPYDNREPGADWLRIQSQKSIMAGHNKFNELGEKIKNTLL